MVKQDKSMADFTANDIAHTLSVNKIIKINVIEVILFGECLHNNMICIIFLGV